MNLPNRSEFRKRRVAYLPHWTRDGAWYAVTFRLWDSLPQHVIQSWISERKNIVKTAERMKRSLSEREEQMAYLYSEKIERYLDAGHGSCLMRVERVAELVQTTLLQNEAGAYNKHRASGHVSPEADGLVRHDEISQRAVKRQRRAMQQPGLQAQEQIAKHN